MRVFCRIFCRATVLMFFWVVPLRLILSVLTRRICFLADRLVAPVVLVVLVLVCPIVLVFGMV